MKYELEVTAFHKDRQGPFKKIYPFRYTGPINYSRLLGLAWDKLMDDLKEFKREYVRTNYRILLIEVIRIETVETYLCDLEMQ